MLSSQLKSTVVKNEYVKILAFLPSLVFFKCILRFPPNNSHAVVN